MKPAIEVIGASANNLRYVDLELPSPGTTLLIGASGSGKSSILANTLAAEGARRNAAFLGVNTDEEEPSPAWIGPLPPSLHIGQRAFRATSRTTIATATGLMVRLRRLFLRYGRAWVADVAEFAPEASPASWAAWLARYRRGPIVVWAVPVRFGATDGIRAVERCAQAGVEQVIVRSETDTKARWEAGRQVDSRRFKPLDPKVRHIIEARIGELRVGTERDSPAIELLLKRAFAAGDGRVVVELPKADDPELAGPFGPRLDSEIHLVHPRSPEVFRVPDRHLLSFNAPEHHLSGACPTCRGSGRALAIDLKALVTEPGRSMHEGAFSLWEPKAYKYVNIQHDTIEGLRGLGGFDPDLPWCKLPASAQQAVLDGAQNPVFDVDRKTRRKYGTARRFEGFRSAIARRVTGGAAATAARLQHLIHEGACDVCRGSRWSPAARALRVGALSLVDALSTPLDSLAGPLNALQGSVERKDVPLVVALRDGARSLSAVGLGHLTGDRAMTAISSGESRRLRLAGVLNSPIDGLLVLLDEPARGLHERDVEGLASAIRALSTTHTLVVSDHRAGLLPAADLVVDMGQDGGPSGGAIVQIGGLEVGASLAHRAARKGGLEARGEGSLRVRHAELHNLSEVDVDIPLGCLTCLTGVSGSGKSSFLRGVLVPELARLLPAGQVDIDQFGTMDGGRCKLEGYKALKGLVALDQKVPPPNRRSLLHSFLDLAEDLRGAFARVPAAKRQGLKLTDFGLNAGDGRCDACEGLGTFGDGPHASSCPRCGGRRFGPAVLSVLLDGRGIADVMNLSIDVLAGLPDAWIAAHRGLLETIVALGLGYLTLDRRVDTLSGGEVQRIRIARALASDVGSAKIFVLDEPAAGLHPVDVERLLGALGRMLEGGRNTVLLVEHNLTVIEHAAHIIEFGPGSGPEGGKIVAQGDPRAMRRTETATGLAMRAGKRPEKALAAPRAKPEEVPRDSVAAGRARDWLRLLSGDDVEPPDVGEGRDALGIIVEGSDVARSLLEVGRLDHELVVHLLENHERHADEARKHLLATWDRESHAQLRIHPFLHEMQVWGRHLPRSTAKPALRHFEALGMRVGRVKASKRTATDDDASGARATGGPLVPDGDTPASRARALDAALVLGAGYVELVRVDDALATLSIRPMDLEAGLIGPLSPKPGHFLRADAGSCVTCRGSGRVVALDENLILSKAKVAPTDEKWLRSEAAEILKGVRRSSLLPFIKSMHDEGLFDSQRKYVELDTSDRAWLLHGFWRRPGPGSFLKPGKPASEVGSWLRWDGLFAEILGQLERSTSASWRAAVEASRSEAGCPTCRGTGYAPVVDLLLLGGRTLGDFLRAGTLAELRRALLADPPVMGSAKSRHEARRRSLAACLASKPLAPARLLSAVGDDLGMEQMRRVSPQFSTLPLVSAP